MKTRIPPAEAANFVKNVEAIMQEKWLSTQIVANWAGVDYSDLAAQLRNNSPSPTHRFVHNVAWALDSSPKILMAEPSKSKLSAAAQAFIAEAREKGHNLIKTSELTGISRKKLTEVINQGAAKFSLKEIIQLQKLKIHSSGFSLVALAPFAAHDVDIVALIDQSQTIMKNQSEWFYKRQAVKHLMREQGFNIHAFSERIGMSSWDFKTQFMGERLGGTMATAPRPSQMHWEQVLKALNVTEEMEKNLVLIGKYKLSSQQVMELRECENIFKIKAQDTLIRNEVAKMTEDELYRLYITMKQEWPNTTQGKFSQSTLQKIIHRVSLTKLAIVASVTLTAFFKSLPISAAETLTEYTAKDCADRAETAVRKQQKLDALLYYAGSDIAKLALLIPKAIVAAIQAPFDVSVDSNLVQHLLNLPMHVVQRFIEASGYSTAIVNDWKEMWRLTNELIRGETHDHIQSDEMSDDETDDILQNLQQSNYTETAHDRHQSSSSNRQTKSNHLPASSTHSNSHQETTLIDARASTSTTNEIIINHFSSDNTRYEVAFEHNGNQHKLEVGLGLEINVGTENNELVSTYCHDGHCVMTMRQGVDVYKNINAPYYPSNNSNQAKASRASINNSNASSNTSIPAKNTASILLGLGIAPDNKQSGNQRTTNEIVDSCMANLQSVQDSQREYPSELARNANNIKSSNLSAKERPTITVEGLINAKVALAKSQQGYYLAKFGFRPKVTRSGHNFISNSSGEGGSGWHCDSTGCYRTNGGGGNNCDTSSSDTCKIKR